MSIPVSLCSQGKTDLHLKDELYSIESVRAIDEYTIQVLGIPGVRLMKRAGRSAVEAIRVKWPEVKKMVVLCGGGNNGGDGYVVAALAAQKAIDVSVFTIVPPQDLTGDAKLAYEYALQEGVSVSPFNNEQITETQGLVVVDAILGIGFKGSMRENIRNAVAWVNEQRSKGVPIAALDVPSGLNADTGYGDEDCVSADLTVTFVGLKKGLITGGAIDKCGELILSAIEIPPAAYEPIPVSASSINTSSILASGCLPARKADAHKGQYGHVCLVGGNLGYGGAINLAGEAVARTGAGLTSVCTRPEHVPSILSRTPEVMAVGVVSGQELEPYLVRPSVLVLGPGFGAGAWAEQMFQKSVATELPIVVDAEALTILAAGKVLKNGFRDNWVLTPHPGEAARLLNCSTEEVQRDRYSAAREIQKRYGGIVALKGAGTVVDDGVTVSVANVGNPGLSSGGTGDVLSGIIGGLVAQGVSLADAAKLGVCVHGEAADLCAKESGQRGMLASDLIPKVRMLLNS